MPLMLMNISKGKDDDVLQIGIENPDDVQEEHRRQAKEDKEDSKDGEEIGMEGDAEMESPDGKSETRMDDSEEYEQLFAAVMTARDGERNISEIFQLLPSRVKYPEYYQVIKNPIDLKMIATKIQDGKYSKLDDLERDLNLMIRNAQTYNEPKSIIFKDACTLKKIITAKKLELEYKRTGVMKTSERLRTRERTNVQRLSAVCAALRYQSEDDDTASSQMDFEGDSDGEESDSPFWALYFAVKNYTSSEGEILSQPFLKLPSKKFYPDYYKEIKKPMSLYNVRKKIKAGQYQSFGECVSDLNLIFENARKYNQDESKIYKDACTLQRVLLERKRELDKDGAEDETPLNVSPFPLAVSKRFLPSPCSPSAASKTQAVLSVSREAPQQPTDMTKTDRETDDDLMPTPKTKRRSECEVKKKTPKRAPEDGLRKRLNILYRIVYEYQDVNGRMLRNIFMGLPSRKDYPDYYQVIMEPIDMTMIEAKIKADKYPNEQALLCDFELMFNNARHYNEEGSQVYQDADTLDRILRTKWRSMSQSRALTSKRSRSKVSSPLSQKLQDMYETVRDYQDRAGRTLSTPFIKLPLKSDYPDYYEVIKKPMDMQRIQQKLLANQYESVEDMVADFVQMFDNACKYNEPESVIYKDALTLQRVVFEKKMELTAEGTNNVPDVKALVQELIRNLFISTYNSQDDEGRCYSDSFAELPELIERDKAPGDEDPPERLLTFDQIKRNIDRGRYRRMDRFQEDMFKVFEKARKFSRIDSQLYEDAVEMQLLFIKIRDELCKNGELLLTPALSYTERHLQNALETEKREKLAIEQKEDEEKKKGGESEEKLEEVKLSSDEPSENEIVYKDQTYKIGDFVYIEPREENLEPHIMVIESFHVDENGARMMKGSWFYRPPETYHLATRKFLEKEVFKSDTSHGISMSQIMGRCYVMFVKDYFKLRPEGLPDRDVYVCESRYNVRNRCFKKIKVWQVPRNDSIGIVPRDLPLVPIRVASVFATKEPSEVREPDDGDVSILEKFRENVLSEAAPEDGNTYYDQYIHSTGCLKLGDCVYVRSDRDYPLIARIDKIWTTPVGDAFFHGCWFVRPSEIEHSPTRLFYKREVFLSSIEDTNPLDSIIGKCCILHIKEYCTSRPTEMPEFDIYICESKYHELEHSIKRLGKGLKKPALSQKVTDDEIYFFRKPITLQKEPSPLLMRAHDDQSSFLDTESMKDAEVDTTSDNLNASVEEAIPQPEKPAKKQKSASARRQPSGYIVFAGEIRKAIQNENPDSSFGDISRIVGLKWRTLSKEDKEKYEERAKRIAEDMAAKQQEADRAFNDSLNRSQSPWSDVGHSSPSASSAGRPNTPGQGMVPPQPPRPPSPMFVTVPPRTQRLLHSEAYLKYIEGLNVENRTISNFKKTLIATPENTPTPNETRLPTHWLAQGAGYHGSVTNALWALRDLMLKDTLSIARTIPFEDL
ncbi:protein polybromo-1-like isoform X11 [Pomacea canaliculata]|uniref:protein polybromo-1-like isoform X11 n=1 Tax=Pomacea canaliculata TaxID=400727 RepID=UPI000D736B4F|nr:protein polybromo-1-like isoform X11 [Pomacea canaliculata]